MANDVEKTSAGTKVNAFLDKNRVILLVLIIAVVLAVAGYAAGFALGKKAKAKDLDAIYGISSALTDGAAALEQEELDERRETALAALAAYTKKGGVVGVRANMLAGELKYQQGKTDEAIAFMEAATKKGKKAYTASIENFNIAALAEDSGDLEKAAEYYKKAADDKEFLLRAHAMFSYARVLEAQEKYAEAYAAYNALVGEYPDGDWGKIAKTRMLRLQIDGKAE